MVLDTPAEDRFDRIAEMAKAYFQAPIALVSLIDRERQWFKASIGLQPRETPREWAFCHHAIQQAAHSVFVLEDTLSDARFCQNPLVTGDPGIRFYAGAVLTAADGQNLGTLCVIDTKPRQRPQDVDLNFLVTLAKMVVDQLELSKARTILDEHRRLLQNAEAMSGVGHWRFDLISQSITWSDEVYRIHGFPISEKVPSYEELQQYYHEEDRAQLVAAIDRATACGEGYSLGLRIMRPDGQVR
ncbi:MAG: GAF domain-containing protein, partial [Novosphingobium sp.]